MNSGHLNDDGIFLFEAETPQSVPMLDVWRGSQWYREDGKMLLLSQCATLEGNICHSIAKYELVENNHIIRSEIEVYKIRFYKAEELITILKEVGFKTVRIIKAFDKTGKPDENDESIIYECIKYSVKSNF